MARFAYGRHAAKVAIGTYPDDNSYPVGTNEWNEDINNLGMFGFTSVEGTCASNVVTLTGDAVANTGLSSVLRIDGQDDAADDLDGITIAQTNEYDLLYLFAENSGRAITVQHASGNVSTGKIYLLAGSGTKVLSTTTPMLVIRKGNDWYEYGGGAQTTPTDIDIVANNSTNETVYPTFVDGATGTQGLESDTGLTYNPSTGLLTSSLFAGALTGNVTGDASGSSGSCTGNAATATALATGRTIGGTSFDGTANISVALSATATALATARTIGGVSFDGTANINLAGVNTAGNQDTSGTAALATTVTCADNAANETVYPTFVDGATGAQDLETDTGLNYNPSTGLLSAVGLTLSGNLTVNGTTTTVDTATLTVEDPLIKLASGNDAADSVDVGFYGLYDVGGTDKYAGIVRDATDGKFIAFKDLQAEPTTTVNKSGTGYAVATLVANLEGNATGTAATVTTAAQSAITSVGTLTGLTLSGALSGTDVALSGRLKTDKGADVASATATTLGADGNTFDITGTTTIVTIPSTNWAVGNIVHLHFDGVLTVTHSSATDSILLGNQANMTTAAGDVLSLFFNGTNWVEISRSSVSSGGGMHEIQDFDLRTAGQITSYESSRTAGTDGYMYVKQVDSTNDGLFIKIKKNNTAWTEVQIA